MGFDHCIGQLVDLQCLDMTYVDAPCRHVADGFVVPHEVALKEGKSNTSCAQSLRSLNLSQYFPSASQLGRILSITTNLRHLNLSGVQNVRQVIERLDE